MCSKLKKTTDSNLDFLYPAKLSTIVKEGEKSFYDINKLYKHHLNFFLIFSKFICLLLSLLNSLNFFLWLPF